MILTVKNDYETKEIRITRSQKGTPCLWEKGGSYTNTGEVWIIGDAFGRPKKAIYVRKHGDLCCNDHALIPIRKNDTLVNVCRHRDEVSLKSYQIEDISEDRAVVNSNVSINYDMLQAAIEKVYTYHCRFPMYVKEMHSSYEAKCQNDYYDNDNYCEEDFEAEE